MRFEGKKVLVTGGAGFIGSNLVKGLVSEGAEVTVLDDFFTGDYRLLNPLTISLVKGSVTDYHTVDALVKDADIVFNLAARNIIVSTSNPGEDFNVNIGGMLNILIAARKHGIERIVYTSSASVYGNPKHLPINEDEGFVILNPYAASKASAEHYCMAFWESYEVPVTILRYSNVYGPHQSAHNPYCGVISKFFDSLLSDLPMEIHGDGEQTRDFTFVGDAVEATLLASISQRAIGEVFNIGTGKETSINKLSESIEDIADKNIGAKYIDRRDIDNLYRRVLNIEKSRRILRWTPMTSLKVGLYATYKWLLSTNSCANR